MAATKTYIRIPLDMSCPVAFQGTEAIMAPDDVSEDELVTRLDVFCVKHRQECEPCRLSGPITVVTETDVNDE